MFEYKCMCIFLEIFFMFKYTFMHLFSNISACMFMRGDAVKNMIFFSCYKYQIKYFQTFLFIAYTCTCGLVYIFRVLTSIQPCLQTGLNVSIPTWRSITFPAACM